MAIPLSVEDALMWILTMTRTLDFMTKMTKLSDFMTSCINPNSATLLVFWKVETEEGTFYSFSSGVPFNLKPALVLMLC